MASKNNFRFENYIFILIWILGWSLCPALTLGQIAETEQPFKIGLVAPITGPYSFLGTEMKESAVAAVNTINASGGLLGKKIDLLIRDDACIPGQALRVADELISVQRVSAVIGHCPAAAMATASRYQESSIIFIDPFSLSIDSKSNQLFYDSTIFQFALRGYRLGEVASDLIVDAGIGVHVGIIEDGSEFSREVTNGFSSYLRSGVSIAFVEIVEDWENLYTLSRIQRMKKEVDVLFFTSPILSSVQKIIPFLSENFSSLKIVVLGMPYTSESLWQDFWKEVKNSGAEAYVLAPSLPKDFFLSFDKSILSHALRDLVNSGVTPRLSHIYVIAAFELLARAIQAKGSADSYDLKTELRSHSHYTMLGSLQSGESGQMGSIEHKIHEPEKRWAPSSSFKEMKIRKPVIKVPGEEAYNLHIDLKKSVKPLILIPARKTKLTFYIGPESADSVLKGMKPSEDLHKIAGGKELGVTVTLDCLLCLEDTLQKRQITYDPNKRISSVAEFEIVPETAAVAATGGLGTLIFTVDACGVDLDRIQVQAFVGDPTPEQLSAYTQPSQRPFKTIEDYCIEPPDLEIDIAWSAGGKIPVVLTPRHPKLKEQLSHLQDGSGSVPEQSWKFVSGVNKSDLDGKVFTIYKAFKTISEQKDIRLQQVYWNIGYDVELSKEAARLEFNNDDLTKMLRVLRNAGAELYIRMFKRGDNNLRKAMDIIETFKLEPERTLRITIRAADVYAPWQILYPSKKGNVDPNKFWGFRYELGTIQKVDSVEGRVRNIFSNPLPNEIAFAGWRGKDGTDMVAATAQELVKHLQRYTKGPISPLYKREEFIDRLKEEAHHIKFIMAFGHGSSGTVIMSVRPGDPSAPLVVGSEWEGSRFLFARDNLLIPAHLDSIIDEDVFDDVNNPFVLKERPFVIFNACETGTYGKKPMDNNGFVGAFSRLGAGAIVVTEGPVWRNFSRFFVRDLIDQLHMGKTLREVMLNVRLEHLNKFRNPLGLIYSVYGNPVARIRK